MRTTPLLSLAVLVLLGACDRPVADVPETINIKELETIAVTMAYRQGIAQRCGIDEPSYLPKYLEELSKTDVNPALVDILRLETDKILEDAAIEEQEYLCTPEMFEQSKDMSADAWNHWLELREKL